MKGPLQISAKKVKERKKGVEESEVQNYWHFFIVLQDATYVKSMENVDRNEGVER